MKSLLQKCLDAKEDFYLALSEWRNVPRADGFSPAQMFLSRRQRGRLPTLPCISAPIDQEQAALSRQRSRESSKSYFDLGSI
jgi:hypothetical protein